MIEGIPTRTDGNEQAIVLLKHWYEEALKGEIAFAAVVAAKNRDAVFTGRGGALGMEFAAFYGLELLKDEIKAQTQNQMPPLDPKAPADRVIYNMSKMPTSFDFLGALMTAEMQRIREKAPFPLKISWFWGRDGNRDNCLNTEERRTKFHGIMRPLVGLIGAVEDEGGNGRPMDNISLAPVVRAYCQGERLPSWIIPDEVRKSLEDNLKASFGKMPVTITLREADELSHRNSNMTEWLKLAEWLEQACGEKVLFVRDTAKAREPITGFATCPPASELLGYRAGLYSVAKANLFVSNGPAMLAVFGDRPWLIFEDQRDDTLDWSHTTEGWRFCAGIDPGSQWPWSKPDQRIVWKRDTFEVMRDAWLEHIEPKQEAAA